MSATTLYPKITKSNVQEVGQSLQAKIAMMKRKCDLCEVEIQESRTGVRMWRHEGTAVVTCRNCHQSAVGEGLLLHSLNC